MFVAWFELWKQMAMWSWACFLIWYIRLNRVFVKITSEITAIMRLAQSKCSTNISVYSVCGRWASPKRRSKALFQWHRYLCLRAPWLPRAMISDPFVGLGTKENGPWSFCSLLKAVEKPWNHVWLLIPSILCRDLGYVYRRPEQLVQSNQFQTFSWCFWCSSNNSVQSHPCSYLNFKTARWGQQVMDWRNHVLQQW